MLSHLFFQAHMDGVKTASMCFNAVYLGPN